MRRTKISEALTNELDIHAFEDQLLLAPVHNILPEILGKIFGYCVKSEATSPLFVTTEAPLLLTHVCRRWRQVAHGTPHIWGVLRIFKHRFNPSLLRRWLLCFGSFPLDITFSVLSDCSTDPWKLQPFHVFDLDDWMENTSHDGVVQLIYKQRHRIRRLTISAPRFIVEDVIGVGSGSSRGFEILADLSLDYRDNFEMLADIHQLHIPMIQNIALLGGAANFITIKPSCLLRSLKVSGKFGVEPFLGILKVCSDSIEEIIAKASLKLPYPKNSVSIFLPKLSRLAVCGRSLDPWRSDNNPLMEWIRAPCLRDLTAGTGVDPDVLCAFLAKTSRLTRLSLDGLDIFTDFRFPHLAQTLSEVEELNLSGNLADSDIWKLLTPYRDVPMTQWTLPKLTCIRLDTGLERTWYHSEVSLVRLIQHRAPPVGEKMHGMISASIQSLEHVGKQGFVSHETWRTMQELAASRYNLHFTFRSK